DDPVEMRNLAAAQPARAAAMASHLESIAGSASPVAARTMSAEAQERLRSLGYVAASASIDPSDARTNPASRIGAWNDFEEALSALNAHRREAAGMLAELAKSNPDAPVFATTYARALKESGEVSAALNVYRDAARRWPTDPTLFH